jgi:hypothetical protein
MKPKKNVSNYAVNLYDILWADFKNILRQYITAVVKLSYSDH